MTLEQIQREKLMTDEQIINLLQNMTEEEAKKFLELEEMKSPMSEAEIIAQTGILGAQVLEFLKENYKAQYSILLMSEEMLPLVSRRVEEARELRTQIEKKELEKVNINQVLDTMENIQLRNQARAVADEIIQEEILFRPLTMEMI